MGNRRDSQAGFCHQAQLHLRQGCCTLDRLDRCTSKSPSDVPQPVANGIVEVDLVCEEVLHRGDVLHSRVAGRIHCVRCRPRAAQLGDLLLHRHGRHKTIDPFRLRATRVGPGPIDGGGEGRVVERGHRCPILRILIMDVAPPEWVAAKRGRRAARFRKLSDRLEHKFRAAVSCPGKGLRERSLRTLGNPVAPSAAASRCDRARNLTEAERRCSTSRRRSPWRARGPSSHDQTVIRRPQPPGASPCWGVTLSSRAPWLGTSTWR